MSRILVVEDVPTQRYWLKMLLERHHGWQVLFAENGCDAISVIEKVPVEVVVTDMLMPMMNGLELIEAAQHSFPKLPVIFLPSSNQARETIAAIELGAVNYTPEANVNDELVETVGLVLDLVRSNESDAISLDANTQMLLTNDQSSLIAGARSVADAACREKRFDSRRRIQLAVALYSVFRDAVDFGHLELEPALRRDQPDEFKKIASMHRNRAPDATRRLIVDVSRDLTKGIQIVVQHEGRPLGPARLKGIDDLAVPPSSFQHTMLLANVLMDEVHYDPVRRRFKLIVPVSAVAVTN